MGKERFHLNSYRIHINKGPLPEATLTKSARIQPNLTEYHQMTKSDQIHPSKSKQIQQSPTESNQIYQKLMFDQVYQIQSNPSSQTESDQVRVNPTESDGIRQNPTNQNLTQSDKSGGIRRSDSVGVASGRGPNKLFTH